jgi:hypothetical protein
MGKQMIIIEAFEHNGEFKCFFRAPPNYMYFVGNLKKEM